MRSQPRFTASLIIFVAWMCKYLCIARHNGRRHHNLYLMRARLSSHRIPERCHSQRRLLLLFIWFSTVSPCRRTFLNVASLMLWSREWWYFSECWWLWHHSPPWHWDWEHLSVKWEGGVPWGRNKRHWLTDSPSYTCNAAQPDAGFMCTVGLPLPPPTPDFPLNLFWLSAIIIEEGEVHARIHSDEGNQCSNDCKCKSKLGLKIPIGKTTARLRSHVLIFRQARTDLEIPGVPGIPGDTWS